MLPCPPACQHGAFSQLLTFNSIPLGMVAAAHGVASSPCYQSRMQEEPRAHDCGAASRASGLSPILYMQDMQAWHSHTKLNRTTEMGCVTFTVSYAEAQAASKIA